MLEGYYSMKKTQARLSHEVTFVYCDTNALDRKYKLYHSDSEWKYLQILKLKGKLSFQLYLTINFEVWLRTEQFSNVQIADVTYLCHQKNAKNWHTRCARDWNETYPEHTLNMLWTCSLNMLWTCSEDALKMLWRCSEDALNMLWTCSEHALDMLWTGLHKLRDVLIS